MPITTYEKFNTTSQVVLPEGYVMILKADLQALEEKVGRGEWKDKKWFKGKVGIQRDDKLDEMIFRPFRDELDAEKGGFIHYPQSNGDPWMFLKTETENWLEENFDRVFKNWSRKE